MTSPALRGTRIGQARIRASRADAVACGARCAAIVPGLDLEPAAMPPQAILCVRSLPDPLPGGIDARARQVETRPVAWESAMRSTLAGMLQRAARPLDGPVPPTADAIFFADESEMLACAARDACNGALASHWWWRHLLPSAGFDAVVDAWREAPTYVPAAFESLVTTRAAVAFVRRLSGPAAVRLLDGVLRTHGLESLADAIASLWTPGISAAPKRPPGVLPTGPDAPRPNSIRSPDLIAPPAPWRDIVPAEWDRADLTPEQGTFAAMCLVLRRAPSLPRRQAFKAAVIAHLRDVTSGTAPRSARAVVPRPLAGDIKDRVSAAPDGAPAPPIHRAGAVPPRPPEPKALSEPGERRPVNAAAAPNASRASLAQPTAETTPAGSPHVRAVTHSRAPQELRRVPEAPREVSSLAQQLRDDRPSSTDHAAGVESELAGAFFLLNVALDLELYSHGFTMGGDLDLGVWDFIELVARDVVGDEGPDDPLWALLRDLANPVAASGVASAFPPAAPVLERTRMDLLSPEDCSGLLRRVREHINLVLAVEDAGGFLLRRRGRIVRSPSHLEVHFSLQRHPIEIRVARLDRNPGWIPAAGFHVGFHFN